MRYSPIPLFSIVLLFLNINAFSQLNKVRPKSDAASRRSVLKAQKGNKAVVVDRRLAVLRPEPGLYSKPIERLEPGSKVTVFGEKKADGALFYEVLGPTGVHGWMQFEAVVGTFRRNDDQRLAKLIQASTGFAQMEMAAAFLETFPDSLLRPSVLLLTGDLIETAADELSKEAARSLVRREMAASGAPLHSFYLNHPALDRYTRMGIRFLFNLNTKSYHYDGSGWLEVIRRYPGTQEAAEAKRRLASLKDKMAAQ